MPKDIDDEYFYGTGTINEYLDDFQLYEKDGELHLRDTRTDDVVKVSENGSLQVDALNGADLANASDGDVLQAAGDGTLSLGDGGGSSGSTLLQREVWNDGAVSEVVFDGLNDEYEYYEIDLSLSEPGGSNTDVLAVEVSTDGGSTWENASGDYSYQTWRLMGGNGTFDETTWGSTYAVMYASVGAGAETHDVTISILRPWDPDTNTTLHGSGGGHNSNNTPVNSRSTGTHLAATSIDAIKVILTDGGNVSTGRAELRGVNYRENVVAARDGISFDVGPEVTAENVDKEFSDATWVANEGVAVMTPRQVGYIYEYDPSDESITQTAQHDQATSGFGAAALSGETGEVVMAPRSGSGSVGVYDPVAKSYTSVSSTGDYYGITEVPDSGLMVMSPFTSDIGVYDPVSGTFTTTSSHGEGTQAFNGATYSSETGNVILTPYDSNNVGIYDPVNETYTSGASHGIGSGAFNWGVELPDGRIAFAPRRATKVGLYDPVDDSFELSDGAAGAYSIGGGTETTKGIKLLPDGRTVTVPMQQDEVFVYDFETDTLVDAADVSGVSLDASQGKYSGAAHIPEYNQIFMPNRSATETGIVRY